MMKSLGKEVSDEKLFMDYLKYGGFPQRFYLPDEESVETYLRDIMKRWLCGTWFQGTA